MITDLGHIALRVPDLDTSVVYAEAVLGLRVFARDDQQASLTCDARRERIRYIAGDRAAYEHVGFEVDGPRGLAELADRLHAASVEIESSVPGPGVSGDAFRFRGPDGHRFEAYCGGEADQPLRYVTAGLPVSRVSHVALLAPDLEPTERFLVDVLGLRVSDRVVPGVGSWLRCNDEHHVIALIQGPNIGLDHYAFDARSFADLARLGDLLALHGIHVAFGPGRHGPGDNLFTYHVDPAGMCVEVSAEMQKIFSPQHVPGAWSDTPETEDLWGGQPSPEIDGLWTPNAD